MQQSPLDLKMQREAWKYDIGDRLSPQASPAVAGGAVYFGSDNGNFYALDEKTGQARWTFKSGARTYWASPVVSGETVYCAASASGIYALNAKTGEERWKLQTSKGARLLAIADGVLYIVDYEGFINAVDARDGKPKPEFRRRHKTESAIAVYDGMLYFTGARRNNIYAVDAKTGEDRWKFQREEMVSSPVIADGLVNFVCADQKLYAVDAKTGKKVWAFDTKQPTMSVPTIANGAIYFISDDGKLHAVK